MRFGYLAVLIVSAISTLYIDSASCMNIGPGLQSLLESGNASERIPIIIGLSEKIDTRSFGVTSGFVRGRLLNKALRKKAARTQKPLINFLKGEGATRIKSLWMINSIVTEIPKHSIHILAEQPGVETIVLDRIFSVQQIDYEESTASRWNISAIRAPELWALGYTGQGVVVASVDTGVDVDHPDLNGKWRAGTNSWFDPHGEHASPYDAAGPASGHGTQTTGIILGGLEDGAPIGVAPDAQWIAAKIFDDAGQTSVSDIHLAFQWLLDPDDDPDTDDAPDVVNNSWGLQEDVNSCILDYAEDIRILKEAGIAVVCAAGNAGPNPWTSLSPANYPESFAVGAVDDSNVIALFSSRGPSPCPNCPEGFFPNVVAPGVSIRTTARSFGGLPNSYVTVLGTSFACSHVAGSMALLLSAFADTNDFDFVDQMEWAMQLTALDLGPVGPDYDYGYGLIDVLHSYELIAADINHDNSVAFGDYAALSGNWLRRDCSGPDWCQGADIDRNGEVNYYDLAILIDYWLIHSSQCN